MSDPLPDVITHTRDVININTRDVTDDKPASESKLDELAFQQKRPPVPLPRTLTPQKAKEDRSIESDIKIGDMKSAKTSSQPREKRRIFKTPEALKTPSYLKPTSASQQRASPRKMDTW
jgi:hypothetical protein